MEKKKIISVKNESEEKLQTYLVGNHAVAITDFVNFRRITFEDGDSIKWPLKSEPFFQGDEVYFENGIIGKSPQEVLNRLALIKQNEKKEFHSLVKVYLVVTLASLLLIWAICH